MLTFHVERVLHNVFYKTKNKFLNVNKYIMFHSLLICLTCPSHGPQLWRHCLSRRRRLRAAASGWSSAWSFPSCWLSSSSSSSTGSYAAPRSLSSSRTPSTPSSRDRRSEVNRKLKRFPVVNTHWHCCMSSQLQAPSVKGFDFAKLHLGQHSKDDIMVIQEPGPLPAPVKEATPSDGGDLNTPKSKGSSTKAARSSRRRGRSDTP